MKHAVEMGSGAVIYILSFRKIGLGIQKLMGGGGVTDRQHCSKRIVYDINLAEILNCFKHSRYLNI
jgi:hypothetical protein